MNLSAFSSDDFNSKDWINAAFESPEAKANKEAYASEVAFKLQLFIQEMNSALEETAQQVQHNLPRVLRDVETMQQEAKSLKEQMAAVHKDIVKVEQDSFKSMKTLLEFDTVKHRMLEANSALREADNWTTLSANVDEVFQSNDIEAITSKLVGMQSSLDILVDVPDYKERCQRLENLKNQLEAMLSPQLVQAFTAQSIEAAKTFVNIFMDIKRLPQLLKYYHNCQKNRLLVLWQKVVEGDSEDTFIDWLNSFYDALLSTWHSQVSWCKQTFPEPPAVYILSDIVVDVLSSLDPSLPFCLDAALKQQMHPVVYLIELLQVTQRLGRSLEVAIQGENADYLNSPNVVSMAQSLFSLYRGHIEKYSSLEEKFLLAHLCLISMSNEEVMDSVRLFGESVPKLMNLCNEAESHCYKLSQYSCYPSMLKAVKNLIKAYIDRCRSVLYQLKGVAKQGSEDLDNWTLFQHSLNCMQTCGEFIIQLGKLDRNFAYNIGSALKQLNCSESGFGEQGDRVQVNPFQDHVSLLLTSFMKNSLNDLAAQMNLEEFSPLKESHQLAKKLCSEFGRFAFNTVFAEIQTQLNSVPNMKVWSAENPRGTLTQDLPLFSLSPLEYITQIGQYLLTLPQHIEPFILQENQALIVGLRHAHLPYAPEGKSPDNVADYLLGCIAQATAYTYIDAIMQIDQVTHQAANQLVTDIGYLCNVLDDLGLSPLDSLQHLLALLKCQPSEFISTAQGRPQQLVQTVRVMRGIR